MTSTKSVLIKLLLLICLSVSAATLPRLDPAKTGMSTERLQRLTNVLQSFIDEKRNVGMVALILRKNSIVYEKAFGKMDFIRNTPMPVNAIFRIASQSKAVTSVAIMMLQEEGKLLIDEPVSKYIP